MNITIKSFSVSQVTKDISFFVAGSRERVKLRGEGRDHNGDMWVSDANGSRLLLSHVMDARENGCLIVMR